MDEDGRARARRSIDGSAVAADAIAAALVTLSLTALARLARPEWDPLVTLGPWGQAAAILALTTVVAVAVNYLWPKLGRWPQAAATTTIVITLVLVLSGATIAMATHPGRAARSQAQSMGTPVPIPESSKPGRYEASAGGFGTGYANLNEDGTYTVHTRSEKSNLIAWFPSADPGPRYYAEVRARRTVGPIDKTACVLSFGWRDQDWWYALRLRDGEVRLSRYEGSIPGRQFEGPLAPDFLNGSDGWHRLGVLRSGQSLDLYVDDRIVFHRRIEDDTIDGGVTFGTLDVGGVYKGDMECEFVEFRVYSLPESGSPP